MEEQGIVKQEESAVMSAATFANVYTTVNIQDRSGKNAVLRALNDAESLAQFFADGDVLNVVDFVVTPGVRRSRQAGVEDTECVNVYIITAEGRAYFSQSDGIAKSVQQILGIYGPGELRDNANGYTRMAYRSRTLANGNTIKTLVPVD